MTAGHGGMGGESPPWGKTAARTPPIGHSPSVGTDTLGAAISHFHSEHPEHVQGEGLQHKGEKGIHHPINSVYKGQMTRR
jgi:hypothetical protein